ncbi:uncharacterized protein BYT42DRAFT_570911 [Radiomyces spectabilis]|uniref:uncharacterized protein n=1 Tax=Radiomyces spectabilis TaxID=64574 RepID=UPI00221EF9DB|nr:uncharacterized protein BYT42DRAFT_570911 [Radiomyces spectabilis]KAI8377599.1 hypothetical protein BYT42DRAFT_570911 [Radiomyces spectabilis]
MQVHGFFHESDIIQMCDKLPIAADATIPHLDCTIQFHEGDTPISPTDVPGKQVNMMLVANQVVRSSFIPSLLTKNGPYAEPSTELLALLNYDFRISPSLLHAVAKLYTGAIIIDKEMVFAITVEAYCRGKATDIHGETNFKTLPSPSTCVYGSLSIGVFEESDGKAMKKKLKIDSKHMNVLVTLSCRLQSDSSSAVDIGPTSSCSVHSIDPSSARILFRQSRTEEFSAIMKHEPMSYSPAPSITSMRQLISGFNHPSTFAMTRASHEEFDSDLLMPCSIFTVCDLPHNQGYGSAANSVGKVSSRFLQVLGLSFIKGTPASFESAIESFLAFSKTKGSDMTASQSLSTLKKFIEELNHILKDSQALSPVIIATKVNFSTIAIEASTAVSLANQKIKKDVLQRLQTLYNNR